MFECKMEYSPFLQSLVDQLLHVLLPTFQLLTQLHLKHNQLSNFFSVIGIDFNGILMLMF